ncbi:REST corepressor 3-like [Amphiura filiformis]|uniref:REST corepressor 3-like n=1 Tax=Amphiura filiformis TaxID=82378 RepID=UPI003B219A91
MGPVRGGSTNGNPSEDSASSSDDEHEPGMRVGQEYQAEIPEIQDVPPSRRDDSRPEALLVWSPGNEVSETKLDEYITLAKDKYGYNTEQALGMLFWHKHSIEKSLADLPNFTPFPDEWTVEDRVLFEQAFSFHGKSFHRIRQMLPDKSISCLVKYYYQWKKTRTRTSLMDRQARKLASGQKGENESEGSEDNENGVDKEKQEGDAKEDGQKVDGSGKSVCSNCTAGVSQLYTTPKGLLCNACYSYWRRTGVMRTHVGPVRNETSQSHRHHPLRTKKKPPKGMYLDHEDLMAMTTNQSDAIFKALDTEIVNLKKKIQYNKQVLSHQKEKVIFELGNLQPGENNQRNKSSWTSDEQLLAVQAIRKYGRDYQAIAEVVGNKTASQCRSFMNNFARRFNLDQVLAEYDADNENKDRSDVGLSISHGSVIHPMATTVISSVPPPLLRPSNTPAHQQKPPMQTQPHRFMQPRGGLHQPPPLIRPSSSITGPLAARSRPPIMGPLSGPPPQLVGNQREPSPQGQ